VKHTTRNQNEAALAMRRRGHDEIVHALRDGRRQRAVRFIDRRKEQDRRACRGRHPDG